MRGDNREDIAAPLCARIGGQDINFELGGRSVPPVFVTEPNRDPRLAR